MKNSMGLDFDFDIDCFEVNLMIKLSINRLLVTIPFVQLLTRKTIKPFTY